MPSSGQGQTDSDGAADSPKVSLRGLAIHRPLDAHRVQIERLMARADKPIELPAPKQPRNAGTAPPKEFVRNVQGSSAGAGSGDFHVYRAHRRREYARLKQMDEATARDAQEQQHAAKLAQYREEDEQKTAKNRAKRLRRKQRQQDKPKRQKTAKDGSSEPESEPEAAPDAEAST
ncbi:hypothetical protein RI367_000892 [Sorochytrium milnesiophthora]